MTELGIAQTVKLTVVLAVVLSYRVTKQFSVTVVICIRKQHDLYVNNLVGDVKANPRDFYRYINSQKKDTQDIPLLKRKNGKGVAQSDLEKADEFNGQFTDVFWIGLHLSWMILLFLRME